MIKDDINNAIADTCIEIIQEPLLYFSEADIQQLLVENLKGRIKKLKKISKNTRQEKTYSTNIHRGKDSQSFYETPLLHREYGGGKGTRIDIVIFSEDDVKKINDPNLTISKKYLAPDFVFELGTEKTRNIKKHLENDIKKINNVKNAGYIIHIYKDRAKSPTGTGRRNNTVEKIKKDFKIVFKNHKCANVKIKKLAILLSPFKEQKLTRGKCEIFNGSRWEDVNVAKENKLREKIIEQLG